MTGDTCRLVAASQHRVTGLDNRMIAVTGRASGDAHLREDLAMRALVKQLGIDRMALPADVGNGRNSGRRRAVVAVAVIARRRR